MMSRIVLSVTKTQIQLPEELYAELKEFARKREWSLAETLRRGAEILLQVYGDDGDGASAPWKPPTSGQVGWRGLSAEQLRDLAAEDQGREPFGS